MKRIIYIISSVCLLAGIVSCDKNLVDSTEVATDLMILSASVEDDAEVKTILNNEKNKSHWCKEDQLSIFDGTNHRQFSIKDKASYEPAATAEFEGETLADASAYMALYPYTATATFERTTIKNAVLPNTQILASEGTFADGAALSVAYSTVKSSYSFKNVATVISFTLNQDASYVEFIANGGEDIAGTVDVSYSGVEDPTYTVQSGKGYDTVKVTGDFKSGSTYYFTILPDVTFSAGYTFKINGYIAKTGAVGKKLERSKIYNISGDLKLVESDWVIKGEHNNWGNGGAQPTKMYKINGLEVAVGVNLTGGFKFNNGNNWIGGVGAILVNHELPTGPNNIVLDKGLYDIYYNTSSNRYYIMSSGTPYTDATKLQTKTYTIHVNDHTGWSNIYCHMYTDGLNYTGSWPGKKLSETKTINANIYKYSSVDITMAEGSSATVMFTNNAGNETPEAGRVTFILGNETDLYFKVSANNVVKVDPSETRTIYLDASKWSDNGAVFAAHFWGGTSSLTSPTNMNSIGNNVYECEIGVDDTNIIFIRRDPNNKESDLWKGVWNRVEVKLDTNKSKFVIGGYSYGSWQ